MLSHNYSYQECLDNSKKVAWKEDDVFAGKNFDFSKRFLPNRLSGVDNITCAQSTKPQSIHRRRRAVLLAQGRACQPS